MPDTADAAPPTGVFFRADASPSTGGGHIMRCMALAAALSRRGVPIGFIVGADTIATVPALATAGYRLVDAQSAPGLAEVLSGVGVGSDALLVIDHYGVDIAEVSACRAVVDRIVVVDDLADRPRDCDLLLNQNILADGSPYGGILPAHAVVLTGPHFALLRPSFAQLREASRARRRSAGIHRIFVSFGLTDVGGWALWVAQTLACGPFAVDIAVGGAAETIALLRDIAGRHSNIHLHVDAQDVAGLMAAADIAIGAGGSTSWERCCLGLPSIVAVVAENQRAIADALASAGAALLVTAANRHELPEILTRLHQDSEMLAELQRRSALICDGLGAERVADALLALPRPDMDEHLAVRPSTFADRADFWLIRNNPATRAVSGDRAEIGWDSHVAWWEGAIAEPGRLLLTAELGGRAVGYIRFDLQPSGDYVTSIALAPHLQGRGLGGRALTAALAAVTQKHPDAGVIARVHQNNIVSINMFKRCGLEEVGAEGDFLLLRLSPRRDAPANPGVAACP